MLIRRPPDIATSEVTDPALYVNRRDFIKAAGIGAMAAALGVNAQPSLAEQAHGKKFEGILKSCFSSDEKPSSYDKVASYKQRPSSHRTIR